MVKEQRRTYDNISCCSFDICTLTELIGDRFDSYFSISCKLYDLFLSLGTHKIFCSSAADERLLTEKQLRLQEVGIGTYMYI